MAGSISEVPASAVCVQYVQICGPRKHIQKYIRIQTRMCTSMCAEGGGLFTRAASHRVFPGRLPLPALAPGAAASLVSHLGLTGGPHATRLIGLL